MIHLDFKIDYRTGEGVGYLPSETKMLPWMKARADLVVACAEAIKKHDIEAIPALIARCEVCPTDPIRFGKEKGHMEWMIKRLKEAM
jgi:hypothetical protein